MHFVESYTRTESGGEDLPELKKYSSTSNVYKIESTKIPDDILFDVDKKYKPNYDEATVHIIVDFYLDDKMYCSASRKFKVGTKWKLVCNDDFNKTIPYDTYMFTITI